MFLYFEKQFGRTDKNRWKQDRADNYTAIRQLQSSAPKLDRNNMFSYISFNERIII